MKHDLPKEVWEKLEKEGLIVPIPDKLKFEVKQEPAQKEEKQK